MSPLPKNDSKRAPRQHMQHNIQIKVRTIKYINWYSFFVKVNRETAKCERRTKWEILNSPNPEDTQHVMLYVLVITPLWGMLLVFRHETRGLECLSTATSRVRGAWQIYILLRGSLGGFTWLAWAKHSLSIAINWPLPCLHFKMSWTGKLKTFL